MTRRALRSTFGTFIAWGAIVLATAANAQGVTGSAVSGTVKDPQGMGVEAALELRNTATGATWTATSNASGEYFINNVVPGPYVLSVSSGGFEVQRREGITLALGERLRLDIPMAYMGEAVEIISHADQLDDHNRTGLSTTVNEQVITRLPLQGRNFTSLIGTSSKVSVSPGGGVSFAGQNNRYNNIQIDGGANNDLFGLTDNGTPGGQANAKPVSLEAVQEFVVQVAPFDVRQGNFAGGLVNAITKSGSNDFHGSLFAYYQDKTLAGFKDDPSFTTYHTAQYGATFSGPIVKDKAHFFIATDLQDRSSAFGSRFNIPGTGSAADIKAAGFDTAAVQRFQSILAKYGINGAGDASAPGLGNPDNNLFVKVSSSVIGNSQLELSYNFVHAKQDVLSRDPTSPFYGPAGLNGGYQLSNSGYSLTDTTHTVRAKLTSSWDGGKLSNEFLAGLSLIRDKRATPGNFPLILVHAGRFGAGAGVPAFLAAGGERFSQANALDQNVLQLQDNLTYSLNRHRITVGTSNEFIHFRNVFLQAATGAYAFDSLDDFDAGKVRYFERRIGASSVQDPGTARFGVSQLGLYVQDEWSILRNLTLQPGLRIDIPFLSANNGNPALLANAAFPVDTGRIPTGNLLWSPRLGINFDVDGSGDTVLRGGAGIFTGRPPYVWISNAYGNNGLAQAQISCDGSKGPVPAFTADPNAQPTSCSGAGGTVAALPNQEIDYFDPNVKYPQNFRLALGADRRLPFGIVGSADVMYTRDVNGWYVNDRNLQVTGTSAEGRALYGTPDAAGTKLVPARYDTAVIGPAVQVYNKDGGHTYDATLQVQKRFAQVFFVTAGYTYSRSYDRMSLTSSQAYSNFRFAPVDGDLASRNLRPSAFDRPHRVTVTGNLALPLGFGVAATYVGQSGLPYTWIVNGDVNGDGATSNDPVYVPANAGDIKLQNPAQYAALSSFIDSQSCLREARGTIIRRGACRNQWQDFLDVRFSWMTPEFRGQHVELQFDIFNVLNLLNDKWGHYDQVASFETATLLKAVGYDKASNRPVYTFVAPTTVNSTFYSPTQSRWRMQLGGKFVF